VSKLVGGLIDSKDGARSIREPLNAFAIAHDIPL
jgi:hypothetical protein